MTQITPKHHTLQEVSALHRNARILTSVVAEIITWIELACHRKQVYYVRTGSTTYRVWVVDHAYRLRELRPGDNPLMETPPMEGDGQMAREIVGYTEKIGLSNPQGGSEPHGAVERVMAIAAVTTRPDWRDEDLLRSVTFSQLEV